MCKIADQLRSDWYKTTVQIDGVPIEEQKAQIIRDRQTPAYQAAIRELIDHMSICSECAKIWDPPKPTEETVTHIRQLNRIVKQTEKVQYTDV